MQDAPAQDKCSTNSACTVLLKMRKGASRIAGYVYE